MSDVAIRVEGLGKEYRLGARKERYQTFGDQIKKWTSLRRLLRRARNSESHPPFWALKNVSFEVKKGEVVGIIGRNGAGKSTLLKILSRITEPTEGGADIYGRVGSLLEVGTGFHPELTGRENVYLNGAILGMKRSEIMRKFDEIVAFAEVEKFIDTAVKHYSSGMYMRLAFAVAAHLDPEILIVDEVLAVGDANFQKKCLGKMGDVAKGGRTVLFVSHQLGSLKNLCSSGLLLSKGCSTAFDSIERALKYYLSGLEHREANDRDLRHVVKVASEDDREGRFHVFFGESLVIRTHLKDLPRSSGLTISINDMYGKRISLLSTNPHDGVSLPAGKEIEVVFTIPFCGFSPGEYSVNVAVTEPNVRIIEEFPFALKFEVLPVERGGTLAYKASFGDYFPDHRWAIIHNKRTEMDH